MKVPVYVVEEDDPEPDEPEPDVPEPEEPEADDPELDDPEPDPPPPPPLQAASISADPASATAAVTRIRAFMERLPPCEEYWIYRQVKVRTAVPAACALVRISPWGIARASTGRP